MEENNNNQKPVDIKELQEKLELAEKERDEYLNGWKRAKADLLNTKKDWEEQLAKISVYAAGDIIKKILPLMDALDEAKNIDGWQEIQKLGLDVLKKNGVEEIQALGQEFNPEFHESVGMGEGAEHQVIEVLQKGYILKGQVLRPAKVKIGLGQNK